MAAKRSQNEIDELPEIDPAFEGPGAISIEEPEPKLVDFFKDLSPAERKAALIELVRKFAIAWDKEQDEWVRDTDVEIAIRDDVCTIKTIKGEIVKLDADYGDKLFCQMNHSARNGKAESVSVYVHGKFTERIPINITELRASSGEPIVKKTKFEKIKTGKGGWATYEVDADCVM